MSEFSRFAEHLYGNGNFHLAVCSNDFQKKRTKRFDEGKTYAYPILVSTVEAKIAEIGRDGFDAYICAHGVRDSTKGRIKWNAAFVHCLWADLDGAPIPTGPLAPTMVVETSPGRWQVFYALSRALEPTVAEAISHRLTDAIGADAGGWMLTKLVRPAGSISYKHGTPFTVRIAHLEPDRKIDPDELDRILPQAKSTPKPPTVNTSAGVDPDDEPPILLSPAAMAVWRGERPVLKRDGSGDVDRSESLFKIACALWECGANRRLIVAELAERDMSLGWERYSGRAAEYERIADKVAEKPRLFGPIGTVNNPPRTNFADGAIDATDEVISDQPCSVQLAAALRRITEQNERITQLRTDVMQLRDENTILVRLTTNPHAKNKAPTIIRAASRYLHAKRNGLIDDDGFAPMSHNEIGDDFDNVENPILSGATVGRHLEQLAQETRPDGAPLLERKKVKEPTTVPLKTKDGQPLIDPETGQRRTCTMPVERTWAKFTGDNLGDILRPFAYFRPPETKSSANDQAHAEPRAHGGDRRSKSFQDSRTLCPDCGSTERVTYCKGCGVDISHVVESEEQARFHHEKGATSSDSSSGFQDGAHKRRTRGVVTPTGFQDENRERVEPDWLSDAPDDSIAGSWGRARPMPGFEQSRPDRYTDTSIGGRP
jgi:hypothetical protein